MHRRADGLTIGASAWNVWRLEVRAILIVTVFVVTLVVPCEAQVINGESTADSGYAPRPPAAWTPPSGRPEPSAIDPPDDARDHEQTTAYPHRDHD